VNGEKNASVFHAAFIPLGFVLWYSKTDESTCYATHRSANTGARKSGEDRTGGNEGAETRNCE